MCKKSAHITVNRSYERKIIMSKASKMRINPHTKLPESGKYREERLARKAERRAKRAARREAVFGKDVAYACNGRRFA